MLKSCGINIFVNFFITRTNIKQDYQKTRICQCNKREVTLTVFQYSDQVTHAEFVAHIPDSKGFM